MEQVYTEQNIREIIGDEFFLRKPLNVPRINFVRKTLTTAQILALKDTPITLVPAFNKGIIVVEGITAINNAGSAAYTGANNLEFRYTDASGAKVTADMAAAFINTTANTVAYDHVAGVTTELTPVITSPIVVRVPTANPGAGNGTITFYVAYKIITF